MTYIPGGGGGGSKVSTSGDVALNNPITGHILTYDAVLAKWTNAGVDTSNMKAVITFDPVVNAYKPRPTGYASVEWVGPVDPGTATLDNDTWINTAI